MNAEQRHAQDVNELRQKRMMKEFDKMNMLNLDDQNARLERLIKNFRLNRTWHRIMRWIKFKEWVKNNRKAFAGWIAGIFGKKKAVEQSKPKNNEQ